MSSWAAELVAGVRAVLVPAAEPALAEPMAHYMKDRFPFLGIQTSRRRALVRPVIATARPNERALATAAQALWRLREREYQYVACDFLARHQRLAGEAFLVRDVEPLVVTKSWWDTVDALRAAAVGPLVKRHRSLVEVMWRWIDSDNVWLVRSALIHQLGYGAAADEELLFTFCARQAEHPDFFVRKAIGWALREHAKVAPEAVRAFVAKERDRLSTLSTREALRNVGPG